MTVLYNEIDDYAADWLENLVLSGHLPEGVVDRRDIRDIRPEELTQYDQCHFFAGIGGWPLALRLAGWPDDRPVWTGSCPCQPFSAAGKRRGADDERHLWPAFRWLIDQCHPPVVLGEQVASKDGRTWLSGVRADLEAMGYAVGAADLCAAGAGEEAQGRISYADNSFEWQRIVVSAPHIRQRLFWLADSRGERRQQISGSASADEGADGRRTENDHIVAGYGADGRMGHTGEPGLQERGSDRQLQREAGQPSARQAVELPGDVERMEHAAGEQMGLPRRSRQPRAADFWSDFDIIPCADGKARRVESVTQSMADGLPESLGRLRAEHIAKIEEEILDAAKERVGEALSDLWRALYPKAICQRSTGRPDGVYEARFLLAFLRQLAEQGWAFTKSISCESAEAQEIILRGVWRDEPSSCPSCGRGLDEQRPVECSDTLHLLSSILARHAQAAWSEVFDANARATFPLAVGVPARVGKLRAYGNAIVPQVAAEFIRACEEARGDLSELGYLLS